MRSRLAAGFRHELLIEFLSDKQAKGLSLQTIKFYEGYLTRFLDSISNPAFIRKIGCPIFYGTDGAPRA